MRDFLGRELLNGDIVALGTRSPGKTLRLGVVLDPEVKWGRYKGARVYIHTLKEDYLKHDKAILKHCSRAVLPENLIRIGDDDLPGFVVTTLKQAAQEYKEVMEEFAARKWNETRNI